MRLKTCTFVSVLFLLNAARACPQVVLNEVLPAPGSDWNGDGSYSSAEDEWLEIVNAGASPVDVSGWFVADASGTPRYGFAAPIAPGEHVFVTGEHSADWESANGFSSVGLSLNNSGDTLFLFQAAGGTTTLVDSLAWGSGEAGPDVSLGRWPDGTGAWMPFDALVEGGTSGQPTPGGANGGIAAPKILGVEIDPAFPRAGDAITVRATNADTDGIAESLLLVSVDGGPQAPTAMTLASGSATWGVWEATLAPHAEGTLLGLTVRISDGTLLAETNEILVAIAGADSPVALNEILADPPPDLAGDANGDGVRDTSDDEFVELYNGSGASVDLSGWSLHDLTGSRHVFEAGRVLAPGEFLVVFGGGDPTGIPSTVVIASSGGLSLNNGGDEVRLVDDGDVTRDVHTYGSEGNADESMIRVPDGDGEWTRPSLEGLGAPFSPGQSNAQPTAVSSTSWAEIKALYR